MSLVFRHSNFWLNSIKQFSTATIFQKYELSFRLNATSITLDNIRMLEKFVNANLLFSRFFSSRIFTLDIYLFHSTSLSRVSIDQ